MRQELQNEDALIAPHEIRELLARLTERTVDSIPAHEARTLAGIAVETGVPVSRLSDILGEMRGQKKSRLLPLLAVAGILVVAASAVFFRPHPTPVTTPPSQPVVEVPATIDKEGLIPLSEVRYGPEYGAFLVDPSFSPPQPVPKGYSIDAEIGALVWGAGDTRGIPSGKVPTAQEEAHLRIDLRQLLKDAVNHAQRRGVAVTAGGGEPGLIYEGLGYPIALSVRDLMGRNGSVAVKLPAPGSGIAADVDATINRAVDELLKRLEHVLNFDVYK